MVCPERVSLDGASGSYESKPLGAHDWMSSPPTPVLGETMTGKGVEGLVDGCTEAVRITGLVWI
jgi:hypothetical protein